MIKAEVVLFATWLVMLYTCWGYVWGGWAERMWERVARDEWRARMAAAVGMSWTRESRVRRAKVGISIATVVLTALVIAVAVQHAHR